MRPCLKKHNLDIEILKKCRSVSIISFISKQLERVVAARLAEHMVENNVDDLFQSAYKTRHSTGSALLRVNNEFLRATDDGKVGVLLMGALSSAFDTADHDLMLGRLMDILAVVIP